MEVKKLIRNIVGIILVLQVGSCIAEQAGCSGCLGCEVYAAACAECGGEGCADCEGEESSSSSSNGSEEEDEGCGGCGGNDRDSSSSNYWNGDEEYSSSSSTAIELPPVEEPIGSLEYTLSPSGMYYIVTATGRLTENVVIKEYFQGLPVKEIADYAFKDCYSMERISIPDSIEKIGKYAFQGCTSLKSITIPSSVLEIGKYAFQFCDDLESVSFASTENWYMDGEAISPAELSTAEIVVNLLKQGKPLTVLGKETESPAEKPPVVSEDMGLPMETGTVIKGYGFVYNAALNTYYEHKGMDFAAAVGTEVKAAKSGTVESIYKDDLLWGTEIVIDHGDGLKTVYRFVTETEGLKVGDSVERGEVIATVAEAAGDESEDGSHLHFAVLEDGKYVDPSLYLTVE